MSDFNEKFLDGFYKFASKIYNKSGQGEDKNFIFSPINLSLGLSTLLAGARRGSESEIKHLLEIFLPVNDIHANNSKLVDYIESLHKCISFKYLNHLFIEPSTQPQNEYTEVLNKNYKFSTVSSLNFEDKANSAHVINEWLEKSLGTEFKRKIVEALISSEAKMILVNGLLFKANWFKKFDKNLTKPEDFHCMDGSVIQVDMMRLSNRKFKFKSNAAGIDASICEFPFLNQELSMSIILPSQDTSLAVVESQLTPEVLKDALEEYNFASKVNVQIPKFKFQECSEFSDLLRNLDAPHLFDGYRVDFTGLAPNGQNIFLSKVFNRLSVELDEEGGNAELEATNTLVNWRSANTIGQGTEQFICNRPFMYIIHDHEYRIPLVIGKFTRPE